MLDCPVADLVRKDKRFDELKLKAADYTTKEAVIGLLLKHPDLMQRPIIIRDEWFYAGDLIFTRSRFYHSPAVKSYKAMVDRLHEKRD